MSEEARELKPSEVVIALANLASRGSYDNVSVAAAREINNLYELVAKLINALEESENESEDSVSD